MNVLLAAGLFDSPWLVALIIIGGALVNWLSQRRQEKQRQREEQSSEVAPPPATPAKGEVDMEEVLRRLFGEQLPPAKPAPPPIPTVTRTEPPPPPVWRGQAASRPRVPPPVATAPPVIPGREWSDGLRGTESVSLPMHSMPARVHRKQASRYSALWRDRSSVRRAFVASLVFGPPKGLES